MGLSLIFSLIAGCAQQRPLMTQTDWPSHEQALQHLNHYKAMGRLGYKGPEQRFGANLLWQTAPEADRLLLTNFLGKTLLKLDTTPSRTTLISHEGKRYNGSNASVLVRDLTGINLPIEQMRDWLIGLPTAADSYQLNGENRLASLAKQIDQQLWQVDYQEYDYSTTPSLPRRIILKQDNQHITLVINEWDLTQQ
ncbi:lipoprotein insertase outer membrane protein LolB [Pseudomonadota bacterium]